MQVAKTQSSKGGPKNFEIFLPQVAGNALKLPILLSPRYFVSFLKNLLRSYQADLRAWVSTSLHY